MNTRKTAILVLVTDGNKKLYQTGKAFCKNTNSETRQAFKEIEQRHNIDKIKGHHVWLDLYVAGNLEDTIGITTEAYHQIFGEAAPTLNEAEQLDAEYHASRGWKIKGMAQTEAAAHA